MAACNGEQQKLEKVRQLVFKYQCAPIQNCDQHELLEQFQVALLASEKKLEIFEQRNTELEEKINVLECANDLLKGQISRANNKSPKCLQSSEEPDIIYLKTCKRLPSVMTKKVFTPKPRIRKSEGNSCTQSDCEDTRDNKCMRLDLEKCSSENDSGYDEKRADDATNENESAASSSSGKWQQN